MVLSFKAVIEADLACLACFLSGFPSRLALAAGDAWGTWDLPYAFEGSGREGHMITRPKPQCHQEQREKKRKGALQRCGGHRTSKQRSRAETQTSVAFFGNMCCLGVEAEERQRQKRPRKIQEREHAATTVKLS